MRSWAHGRRRCSARCTTRWWSRDDARAMMEVLPGWTHAWNARYAWLAAPRETVWDNMKSVRASTRVLSEPAPSPNDLHAGPWEDQHEC